MRAAERRTGKAVLASCIPVMDSRIPGRLPGRQGRGAALLRAANTCTGRWNSADGNVTRAAALAGKERRAFGKLLKKHGLSAFRAAA